MGANKHILAACMAAMLSGPTPSYSLSFTSSLPSQVTFARTGSRTAIVAGVLTTVAANTPAIESNSAGVLGLSIEPASTNNLLQSNNFSTTWSPTSVTLTSGQPSPDGGSNGWDVAETASSNYHELAQGFNGLASGLVMCTSVFLKAKAGSTNNAVGVFNCNQYGNAGARSAAMLDTAAVMAFAGDTTFTAVSGGVQSLSNGWTRVWVTGTTTVSGNKTVRLRAMSKAASAPNENYLGVVTNGYELAFAQTEYGISRPTSYKATTTAAASTSADSAIISDLSWLNAAQGTLIVEHDCTSGVLLGSGANTILSGSAGAVPAKRQTGKVALAWSGTTSDLVYCGGTSTSGVQPTFGSDIRLLATSAGTNAGHIKSLTYYPTRLTVAQIQALTAPTSTAPAAGTFRAAAHRAVLNCSSVAISGTQPYQLFRWPANIASGDRSKLGVAVGNWYMNDASGDVAVPNAVTIESMALERVSTGEVVPITFAGSRSLTMASGLVRTDSDDILPSAFTSLAASGVFSNGDQFFIRGKVKCASGGSIPTGRWGGESGAQVLQYDGAATTYSTVDASGAFTLVSGSAGTGSTRGFGPVLIGPFVSGDPMVLFSYGDSIIDGVGTTLTTTGTWPQKAANQLGASHIQYALGGQSEVMLYKSSNIASWVGLGNVLLDNTGTNVQGGISYYPLAYSNAYAAGIRYVLRPSLNVRSSSTDSWATKANQTASLPYPDYTSQGLMALAASGFINAYYKMNAVRDTGDVWITNGTANYYTDDGLHQHPIGDDLMAAELKTQLQAVVLV